jgi:hypothetical protein
LAFAVASFRHRRFVSAFQRLFRFGEGAFTERRRDPQEEKSRPSQFFRLSAFSHKILGLGAVRPPLALRMRNILAAMQRESGGL